MWIWVKKFWWVLAALAVAGFFVVKAFLRERERAAAVQRQFAREKELARELAETKNYRVDKRTQIREEIKATRKELEVRKHELEEQARSDDAFVADYWNRAFGKPSSGQVPPSLPPGEGE